MNTNTKKIALSAMLAALSFVLMYLGTLTGVFDLCAVTLGALGCAFAVIEIGGVWPWLIAAVTGVLSLLLLPEKFAALEYIVLGGIYPILKSYFERLPKIWAWVSKIVYFNVMLTAALLAAKYLMGVDEDWATFSAVVFVFANVFFVIFDIALTMFISVYVVRLRKRFKIKF